MSSSYKKNIKSIGVHIRQLREKSNYSLKEVATNIGIDTSLLGKIERDERQPTKEHLILLAAFFNVNQRQLLQQAISDVIAHKIIDEDVGLNTLRVAEKKVEYFKSISKK